MDRVLAKLNKKIKIKRHLGEPPLIKYQTILYFCVENIVFSKLLAEVSPNKIENSTSIYFANTKFLGGFY